MDPTTASQLCIFDLSHLIDADDFRVNKAEVIIDDLVASARHPLERNASLCHLGTALARIQSSRPEGDAFVRALRASVRRRLGLTLREGRLTAGAAGA